MSELKPISGQYGFLFDRCNEARYNLVRVYPIDAQQYFDTELQNIKAVILPLLPP